MVAPAYAGMVPQVSTAPDFTLSTVASMDMPPDDAPALEETDARRCSKCNGILPPHTGRGRKPTTCTACRTSTATARAPRKGTGSTDAALASMDTLYSTAVVILSMFSPQASATMLAQIETAQRMNRNAFESDKALARRVAQWGEVTGGSGFIVAQLAVAAPTLLVLRADLASRKAAKKARTTTAEEPTATAPDQAPGSLAFFG